MTIPSSLLEFLESLLYLQNSRWRLTKVVVKYPDKAFQGINTLNSRKENKESNEKHKNNRVDHKVVM